MDKILFNNDVPYGKQINVDTSSFYDVPIDFNVLTVRTSNCLHRAEITRINILLQKTPDDLKHIRNCGATTIEEIEKYIVDVLTDTMHVEKTDKAISKENTLNGNSILQHTVFIENKQAILNGNFYVFDNFELDDNEKSALIEIENAYNLLDSDFIKMCEYRSDEVCDLINAFLYFINECDTNSKYHRQLEKKMINMPTVIKTKSVNLFIMAYSNNIETVTNKIQNILIPNGIDTSIQDAINNVMIKDYQEYSTIYSFIDWCCFDIYEEVNDLFDVLYCSCKGKAEINYKYATVIEMRANNYTLEDVGEIIGVTRERVRQIEEKVKRRFDHWNKSNRILDKISAFRNGDAVLTCDELKEYFGKHTIVMIYLLKSTSNSSCFYDNQLDVFYIGDNSIKEKLWTFSDSLPNMFDKKDLFSFIELAENNYDIPKEAAEKAINDEFVLSGEIYHKNHIQLKEIYMDVLKRYYKQGIRVYDDDEINIFRKHVNEIYGTDIHLPKNNHAISSAISKICMLCGKGTYCLKKDKYISDGLRDKIYGYIKCSNRKVFLKNALYSVFEKELNEEGVTDKYYFQGILRELFNHDFIITKDYISKDINTTKINDEIIDYIKKSQYPVNKEEIYNVFPGVTDVVISMALSDSSLLNLFGKYICVKYIAISTLEKQDIDNIIDSFVKDEQPHHCDEIFNYINKHN